jgi:hypothetical protein
MTESSMPEVVCAVCSHRGSGRFCSNCGASLESLTCTGCGAKLTPGARFCHECGTPSPSAQNVAGPKTVSVKPGTSASLPWIVAAIALVTLLAFLAGGAFNSRRGSSLDAPQNALPQAGLDDRGAGAEGAPAEGVVRAPDISQLSPQERADRLFNRVMLLNSQGKSDSVLFFAPMAIQSYQMLAPLNTDQRYDLGRIAEVAGAYPLARAQADSILLENPKHLLGLVLEARIASLEKRTADRASYESKLAAAYPSEVAKKLPEYDRHSADIKEVMGSTKR